jgi:hypothetical protein
MRSRREKAVILLACEVFAHRIQFSGRQGSMAEAVQRPDADETARLLAEWAAGRPENASELWTLLYTELKQIAGACMRAERPDHTLQTTALVHEAYLRMYGGKPCAESW